MPSVLRNGALGLLVLGVALAVARPAGGGPGDVVYHQTAHGSPARGVNRTPAYPVGTCRQCHSSRSLAGGFRYGLFANDDNGLCFGCHAAAGTARVYLGQTTFLGAEHATSPIFVWPGPTPPPRAATEAGLCLNCHSPHGRRDSMGLVPAQAVAREEALCLSCHDATGPAGTDLVAQLARTAAHPVVAGAGIHATTEGLTASAFGSTRRHAECVDCHNPHAIVSGTPLAGISRIGVTNGAALTVPTYVPRLGDDPAPIAEYEVCFKCHSSWTALPAGSPDLAFELNTANASFHPIEGAGTNATAAMTRSLATGTGLPHLTTTSRVTCSDCHGSEALPTTVSVVSSYMGAEPTGPHGSNAGATAGLSGAILRAPYRNQIKAPTDGYNAGDFTLCFVCHGAAPFTDRSGDPRTDTNYRFHGKHVSNIAGAGSGGAGGITTPGAGDGHAICAECHYDPHGVAGAYHSTNRSNARLVNFAPNVTGLSGTGQPIWSQTGRSCTLRCHGVRHDPFTY